MVQLGTQVGLSTLLAHGRDAHAQQQRLLVVDKGDDQERVGLVAPAVDGSRELGIEEELLVVGPSPRMAMSTE